MFTLDKAPGKHILMIGTGTGLAPYMSMLRSELVCNGSRQFVVVHGARYSWDLGYRTELTGLARHCGNFHYIPSSRGRRKTSPGGAGAATSRTSSPRTRSSEETGPGAHARQLRHLPVRQPGHDRDGHRAGREGRGFVRDKGHDIGTLHTEEYW